MNSMSSACFIRLSRPCAHLCSIFRQYCSSLLAMRKANCYVEEFKKIFIHGASKRQGGVKPMQEVLFFVLEDSWRALQCQAGKYRKYVQLPLKYQNDDAIRPGNLGEREKK